MLCGAGPINPRSLEQLSKLLDTIQDALALLVFRNLNGEKNVVESMIAIRLQTSCMYRKEKELSSFKIAWIIPCIGGFQMTVAKTYKIE